MPRKTNQPSSRVIGRELALRVITFLLVLSGCACASSVWAQKTRRFPQNFRLHAEFKSQFLPKTRQIIVCLPPGYQADEAKRYPVLYLLDGANVFVLWEIDETARVLIEASQIEPLIIVGIAHGGTREDRTNEYTPTSVQGTGGRGDDTGRMLVEELKPFIDREYRTLPGSANTGLGGTSFGGLIALHLGLRHPLTFGKLIVMSPSVWWDRGVILRTVKSLTAKPPHRIWLDVGTGEGRGMVDNVKQLRDALTEKGWKLDTDLAYFEDKGAAHDDNAWAMRAHRVLKFLFPATKVQR